MAETLAGRQIREFIALGDEEWVGACEQDPYTLLNNRCERSLDLPWVARVQADQLQPKRTTGSLRLPRLVIDITLLAGFAKKAIAVPAGTT